MSHLNKPYLCLFFHPLTTLGTSQVHSFYPLTLPWACFFSVCPKKAHNEILCFLKDSFNLYSYLTVDTRCIRYCFNICFVLFAWYAFAFIRIFEGMCFMIIVCWAMKSKHFLIIWRFLLCSKTKGNKESERDNDMESTLKQIFVSASNN